MDIILSTNRGKLCTANLNHILVFTIFNFYHIHRLFDGAGGLDACADSFTPLFAGLCNSSKQHELSSWPLIFNEVKS